MKRISNDSIKKWAYTSSNKLSHPISICTPCPGCGMSVIFNTKRRQFDPHRDTLACTSDCPACDQQVHFWVVDMVAHFRKEDGDDAAIYMLPSTSAATIDFNRYENKVPENVLRYCLSAQDVYFSGNLTATNVLIRTALESIFAEFLPQGADKMELPEIIKEAMANIQLADPLIKLSEGVVSGGDLDILFQHHNTTSQETADAMMALLETLITYLYVMPDKFQSLRKNFEQINTVSTLSRRGDEYEDLQRRAG